MERSVVRRFHDEGILVICSTVESPASEDELMDPEGTWQRLERAAARIATLIELGARL